MRSLLMLAAFGMGWAAWAGLRAESGGGKREAKPGMTLLGTLEEWKYPEAKMPRGAEMSGGGYPGIQSIKCQAVLTTSDEFDKVVSFYEKKFGVTADGKSTAPGDAKADETNSEPQSVLVQDDSQDRPAAMRVFVVNRQLTSTTLVVSRAKGEQETHIAWSEFIRLH